MSDAAANEQLTDLQLAVETIAADPVLADHPDPKAVAHAAVLALTHAGFKIIDRSKLTTLYRVEGDHVTYPSLEALTKRWPKSVVMRVEKLQQTEWQLMAQWEVELLRYWEGSEVL